MKFSYILTMSLLLTICIHLSDEISAKDFCYSTDPLCERAFHLNEIKTKCPNISCTISPYLQKCGQNKCAVHNHECDEFLLRDTYYSSKLFKHFIRTVSKQKQSMMRYHKKMFEKLTADIQSCLRYRSNEPVSPLNQTLLWDPKDFCMRRKKCYLRLKLEHLENDLAQGGDQYVKIECPCDGKQVKKNNLKLI